ncbi:MAG: EamA family transporter [Rhodospirillaceae bacterium]|nr:EamA family transporter [Rhodospirillaceae bacterium]
MHTVLDPLVIGLLLAAALMHATWNALLKADSGDRLATFGVIMLTGSLISLPLIFLLPFPPARAWMWLGLSVLIHNFYYFFLLKAYATGDLSHTYPIARGLGPLLVALISGRLIGEYLRLQDGVGVALVSLGILTLAAPQRRQANGDAHSPEWRRRHRRATLYAVLTGVTIAGYLISDGLGVRASGTTLADRVGYIAWLNVCEGPWLICLALYLRPASVSAYLRRGWRGWWRGAVGGTVAVIGYAIAIWALATGPIAHVAAVRESSVLFAAVMGALLLGEPFGARRIAAAGTIVAGLVLMNGPTLL